MAKQVLGIGPAHAFFADDAVGTDADIVQEHLVHFMVPIDGDDGSDGDPRRRHVHEENAEPELLPGRIGSADQQEYPVGLMRHRGPDFLAVDHPLAALKARPGPEGRKVRTRPGLRETLAPEIVHVEDGWQDFSLLLPTAEFHHDRGEHHHSECRIARCAFFGEHFIEHVPLDDRPAGATEFDRPGRGTPAPAHQTALPCLAFAARG